MVRYRPKNRVHIFSLAIIIGLLVEYRMFSDSWTTDMILLFSIIFAVFNQINILFAESVVDENGITQKSLIKTIKLDWTDVKYIYSQPSNLLVKNSVIICSSNNKIIISSWTKDYKLLLSQTIDHCSQVDTEVDLKVMNLIGRI